MKGQVLFIILGCIVSFVLAYFLCYWIFLQKINRQIHKMLILMKADELKLDRPDDAYEKSDDFFSDLERAAFSLRRKYLRLKKISSDERKAYETVFSGLTEGLVTVDQNLKILSFNTRFIQIFKSNPQFLKGSTTLYLQDVVRRPEIIEAFKRIFSEQKMIQTQTEDLDILINPLPSLDENQQWAMGVFYDLTEVRRIDKMRVDFVANASHELRTPLTVIKGYSDLLAQKVKQEQPDLLTLVQPIVQNSHSMNLLLEDLLNLSKLESSALILKTELSVQEITEDIINEFDSVLSLNQKRIVCRFEAKNVFAEASGLKQIIRNLLNNAIRYSGPQSPVVYLTWTESDQKTILSIKDTGPGIPYEHQPRIFERFYRVDKGRSRDQGGSGLGLALVKHQMINHGGHIQLKSAPGEGTEFICEFDRKS